MWKENPTRESDATLKAGRDGQSLRGARSHLLWQDTNNELCLHLSSKCLCLAHPARPACPVCPARPARPARPAYPGSRATCSLVCGFPSTHPIPIWLPGSRVNSALRCFILFFKHHILPVGNFSSIIPRKLFYFPSNYPLPGPSVDAECQPPAMNLQTLETHFTHLCLPAGVNIVADINKCFFKCLSLQDRCIPINQMRLTPRPRIPKYSSAVYTWGN